MDKRFIIVLLLMFSMTFVLAESESMFKLDEDVNYRFRCYTETGDYCSSTTILIANVEYPNGTNALDNITLTYQNTYFNITLPTNAIGDGYKVLINSLTSNNTITEFPYDVTYSGERYNLQSIIWYVLGVAFLTFLMIASLYASGRIPNGNPKDDYGQIIGISHLKHFKLVLWGVAYILLLAINYLIAGISRNILFDSGLTNVFWSFFVWQLRLTIPVAFIILGWILIEIFRDKELQRLMKRGLPPR